jgi:DNA-binding LacI/PurR family transcriptional regulator
VIAGKSKPRYKLIAEDIRSRIQSGTLRPGEAVPSYRTLMKQHGVTIGTVRQAIQSLQSEQLVESVPRVGSVVAQKKPEWRKVGVALISELNETDTFVIETLHDEFARLLCDVTLHVAPRVSEETLPALVAWAQRQDGVIMRGWVPVRALEALARAGVRVVQCGEPIDGPCPSYVSSVEVSIDSVMQTAIGHLAALGHRGVTLCAFADTRYYQLLGASFLRCCREFGLDGHQHIYERGNEDRCGALLEWLNARKRPPTALVVENPLNASKTIEGLTAGGWPVPERISVVATAGVGRLTGRMEGLTCILTATRELFLRAVGVLLSMMDSRDSFARHEIMGARLLPGRTCRPLP